MYGLNNNNIMSQFYNLKLVFQVVELKEQLKVSQKREDVLNRDFRSLTELLKEAQHNLRLSNDKVQHLTVSADIQIHEFICIKFKIRTS